MSKYRCLQLWIAAAETASAGMPSANTALMRLPTKARCLPPTISDTNTNDGRMMPIVTQPETNLARWRGGVMAIVTQPETNLPRWRAGVVPAKRGKQPGLHSG